MGKVPVLRKFKSKAESIPEFDYSKDTDISVEKEIAPLIKSSIDDGFSSHENLISKLNLNKQQFNMFKYCLSEYYTSKIGIAYFIYLMKLHFKKVRIQSVS